MNAHVQRTIAVLGLGTMGSPFAVNLVRAGHRVVGWNRGESGRASVQGSGVIIADDPAEAVRDADVIILMLSDGPVTLALLERVLPDLRSGAIVVQMATIGADATGAVAALIDARSDVWFVDAPVSGTRAPAVAGTVTVLASGPDDARWVLDPVFATIGGRTIWLGEAGAGTRMKLVLNAWLVAVMNGIAEAAAIARRFGIDYDELLETMSGGPLDTPYAAAKLRKFAADDYTADMALKWAVKDIRLAFDAYEATGGGELPGLERIEQIWSAQLNTDNAERDLAIVHRALL